MTTTTRTEIEPTAYRSSDDGLRARRAELLLLRRSEVAKLPSVAGRIYARRSARSAAGLAAIACTAMLPVAAVVGYAVFDGWQHTEGALTLILLCTPGAALLAYLVAGRAAALTFRRRLVRSLVPSDDLLGDVARLEIQSAEAIASALADGLERRSVALPLIGMALAAPLTIHFLVWLLFRSSTDPALASFDNWILISLVLVSHSHLLLSFLAWRFARNLRDRPVATKPSRSGWFAWLWCWASSAVPGAVLLLIPVGLVLATGLLFVPASFWWMGRRATEERRALEAIQLARS